MKIQVQKTYKPDNIKKSERKFRKKRKTKLVRLSEKWHRQLKMMSLASCNTISKRLDRMCELFFKQNPELRVPTDKQAYTMTSCHDSISRR